MAVPAYQLYPIGGGLVTCSAAATAKQLSTTSVPCAGIMISTISTITGMMAIGNSTAYPSGGALGSGVYLASTPLMFPCRDLSEVYICASATATTEAARFTYFTASVP